MNETENQTRLRRAWDSLTLHRDAEHRARKALTDAVEDTKKAKERYDVLFMEEERQESQRRLTNYRHGTC